MITIEQTAEDLFNKIRNRFSNLEIGDEKGGSCSETPELARFFNFDFIKDGENFGNITISIADNKTVKIFFDQSIDRKLNPEQKKIWFNWLKEMREFSRSHMKLYDVRDIAKSGLNLNDLQFLKRHNNTVKKDEVQTTEVAESKLYGTSRSSYQKLENVRIIARHSKPIVDETIPGARSRNIESFYIENSQGERFRLPEGTTINGARAYARHVKNGGELHDDFSKHIGRMIKEMADLRMFVRNMRGRTFEDIETQQMVESAVDHHGMLHSNIHMLRSQRGYDQYKSLWQPEVLEESDIDIAALRERFVKKIFDDRISDALPVVYREYNKRKMAVEQEFESWASNIVKEFEENPVDKENKKKAAEKQDIEEDEIGVNVKGPFANSLHSAERDSEGNMINGDNEEERLASLFNSKQFEFRFEDGIYYFESNNEINRARAWIAKTFPNMKFPKMGIFDYGYGVYGSTTFDRELPNGKGVMESINEDLRKWFKEKWVRFGPDGKIRGQCARDDDSEGKPKCLPQSRAHALGKKGRKTAANRKRREDPDPERHGPAINVKTKESQQGVAEGSFEYKDSYENEQELYSGCYVRDQQEGPGGEVFVMRGDPTDRRVRIEDKDGRGWYIPPSRLELVDENDPAIRRYFGGVEEGRYFKTAYGYAGGYNEKTGKKYKHPEDIKADREAKRKAKDQEQAEKKAQPGVKEGKEDLDAQAMKKVDRSAAEEKARREFEQAVNIANKLTTGTSLDKLRVLYSRASDSAVYRALSNYFDKHNIPEKIYDRVVSMILKRIKKQDVAEGTEQKTFTVVYYSPGKDRNITKTIKANNESDVWDQLKAKGIDVVSVKEQGVAEGILGDREYNRVMPIVKRIAGEVLDYDQDEFGEELWSLLDQKYGSKFAQSVLQDSLDFYWDEYAELTGQQGVAEGKITKKMIHDLADRRGIAWDNEPSFLRMTEKLTGHKHLDDLDTEQLRRVYSHIKNKQGVAEGTEPQYQAALYIDEFGDGDHWYVKGAPDTIKRFVQLANSLEDEAVKGTDYEPGVGGMAKIHKQLGNDRPPQWQIVPAQHLEQLEPIDNNTLQVLMKADLSAGAQEFMSDLLWRLESDGQAVVHGDLEQGVAEDHLIEACWKGYHKEGMKTMFGKRYPNCVKNTNEDLVETMDPSAVRRLQNLLNKKFGANLDVDGILGPLTIKSIKKYLPKAAKKLAPLPDKTTAVQGLQSKKHTNENTKRCPECGGPAYSDRMLAEKQDACYHKVKSRYKVWPSAYASGALVQCRKKGAKNWGNKSESAKPAASKLLDSFKADLDKF